MPFRLELAHGNGKPRYWEVLCDYCEVVASFACAEHPDFPAAFKHAMSSGWDAEQDARGRVRYSCPSCTNRGEDDG